MIVNLVKLVNDYSTLYMQDYDYNRYSDYDVFRKHAVSLVIIDHVYINIFPLIFSWEELINYNPDIKIIKEVYFKK